MGWKIYFWFLAVIIPLLYLSVGFSDILKTIDFIFFIIAMIGLYAFTWRKKILTRSPWQRKCFNGIMKKE